MPSAAFAGSFLNSFVDAQTAERDRKERNTRDIINFMVSTGRVRDMNDLLPIMATMFPGLQQKGKGQGGGGKGPAGGQGGGKGQQDPGSMLAQWLNPAFQMDQQARQQKATEGRTAGQPITGRGPFMTNEEIQQQSDLAKQHDSDIQFAQFKREEKIRQEGALALEQARVAGRAVKWQAGSVPGSSLPTGLSDIYGQPIDPAKHYRQGEDGTGTQAFAPTESPKETGLLAERTKELIARGIPADRAPMVAALQLDKERGVKQQQAAGNYAANMALKRQVLATDVERYTEMRATFPYSLAMKMAGAEIAELRPELVRQQIAKGSAAVVTPDAQKEASKIVEAATKQAHVLWGKQGELVTLLGWAPGSEEEIRRNLIQEMSGGQDPATVEALASARITARAPTPRTPGAAPLASPAIPTTAYPAPGTGAATGPQLPPGWTIEPAPAGR